MDSLLKSVESKIVSFGEYFLGYFRIMPEKYLLFFFFFFPGMRDHLCFLGRSWMNKGGRIERNGLHCLPATLVTLFSAQSLCLLWFGSYECPVRLLGPLYSSQLHFLFS